MKSFLLTILALVSSQAVSAQTESFDMATFTPPRGWQRAESNGALVFENRRAVPGRLEFCQIYLFPSRRNQGSPQQEFQIEWQSRIGSQLAQRLPAPQTSRNPDGSMALTGFADMIRQGVPLRAILVTSIGFGRVLSVVVMVSPNSYQAEIQNFFAGLRLGKNTEPPGPAPPFLLGSAGPRPEAPGGGVPGNAGPRPEAALGGSTGSLVYDIPNGWMRQEARDRTVLMSPVYQGGERCQLTMLPARTSTRPLGDEAIGLFRQIFQTDPLGVYPYPPAKLASGKSPEGWDYFMIKKNYGGTDGDLGAILLLVQSGGQLATVIGTSKRFLVSNCFGELVLDLWPKFFYSLNFKGPRPAEQERAAIAQKLAGKWTSATGSVGLQYTFTADGRYSDTGATQYRTRVSNTEVLSTTTAFFGNGGYSFDGNMITLTGDDHRQTKYLFRVEDQSNDSGKRWAPGLCLLDPAGTGEVCYRKE